jgi:hypothetical protein
MRVTPNPSTGALTITPPNDRGGNPAVYNSKGAQVSHVQIAAGIQSVALELPNAANGLYRVSFFDDAGRAVVSSKFAVSR